MKRKRGEERRGEEREEERRRQNTDYNFVIVHGPWSFKKYIRNL